MKGRVSMSLIIDVTLTTSEDDDVLVFGFDNSCLDAYVVNLNSTSSQTELKKVFSKLLRMLLENDLTLNFVIADGYSKGLYKDVCKEYIEDLNREIKQIKEAMQKEIS